jgi:hypothetical protein
MTVTELVDWTDWKMIKMMAYDTVRFKCKNAKGTAFTVYARDVCKLHFLPLRPIYLTQIDAALDEIYEETREKPEVAEKLGCKGIEKGENTHRKWWRFEKLNNKK